MKKSELRSKIVNSMISSSVIKSSSISNKIPDSVCIKKSAPERNKAKRSKRVILWDHGRGHRAILRGFNRRLLERGHCSDFYVGSRSHKIVKRRSSEYDLIIIWNGNKPRTGKVVSKFKNILFMERAWFPQSDYIFLDRSGINAKSSLMHDNLLWVNDDIINKYRKFKNEYCRYNWTGSGGYVLVLLQMESDTNIIEHSPIKKMQDLVNFVEYNYNNDIILIKPHPKVLNPGITTNSSIVTDETDLHKLISDSKLVVGINSTALLEARMIGAPVISLGDCVLNNHKNHDKLLAALVSKQIPLKKNDWGEWLEPYGL